VAEEETEHWRTIVDKSERRERGFKHHSEKQLTLKRLGNKRRAPLHPQRKRTPGEKKAFERKRRGGTEKGI